jgi:hypothetical protein
MDAVEIEKMNFKVNLRFIFFKFYAVKNKEIRSNVFWVLVTRKLLIWKKVWKLF